MSVSRPPATARARPAHMDRSVMASSAASSADGSPTVTGTAESLCQPCRHAPQSIEMLSPSASRRSGSGMPCTTSSLIDAQIVPVKPWEPRKIGTAPFDRMWSSAMASSSPVLTPGRTAALTAAMAPAVTSPEARISSISCAVLIWIIRPLHFASSARGERRPAASRTASAPERLERPLGDLLDRADGVDPGQQSLLLVPVRQRFGLLVVDLEPVTDGFGLVVVALDHLAVHQHAPAGQTTHQLVLVDDHLDHAVQDPTLVGQRGLQLLRLRDCPREAVQEKAVGGVRLTEPVLHHGHGDLVGHQVAGVHVGLGLLAELGPTAHVGSEDVARGDGGYAELARDDLGLRPLACPRRTEQHDAHYFRNPS